MDLSNLQPAEGSVHNKNKRVGREKVLVAVEHQHVVIKELSLVQDTLRK